MFVLNSHICALIDKYGILRKVGVEMGDNTLPNLPQFIPILNKKNGSIYQIDSR